MRKTNRRKSFSFEDTLFSFLKCFVFSFVLFVVTIPFLEMYMKEYVNVFFSIYLLCSFIFSYSWSKRNIGNKEQSSTFYKKVPSLFVQYDMDKPSFSKKVEERSYALFLSINQDYLFIQTSLSVLPIEDQHTFETLIHQDLYYLLSSYLHLSDKIKQKEESLFFSSLHEVHIRLGSYKEKIDVFHQKQLTKRNLLLKQRV